MTYITKDNPHATKTGAIPIPGLLFADNLT
jgi:hypothetical protein